MGLMRKYNDQKKVIGRCAVKLIKRFTARSVGMALCINSDVPRWLLREVSELAYFNEHMRRNWAGTSEECLGSRIDIFAEGHVALLDLFCAYTFVITNGHLRDKVM